MCHKYVYLFVESKANALKIGWTLEGGFLIVQKSHTTLTNLKRNVQNLDIFPTDSREFYRQDRTKQINKVTHETLPLFEINLFFQFKLLRKISFKYLFSEINTDNEIDFDRY